MRKSPAILVLAILLLSITTSVFADVAQGVVNINTADVGQLSLLPRVGAKAAQRIVDYRRDHGAFKKTTDLMQVKGFGQKSFDKLSPYIAIEGKTTLTAKVTLSRKAARRQPTATASN